VICDGVLWGRGTLDTKSTLNAIMCAAGSLISAGFVPEHDVYFAFGGDEEINGHGAPDIVDYFEKKNITPGFVLDEGGAATENAFPGVKKLVAMIGIAEKGLLNVKYTVSGGGGHASSPDPITPIGRLSAACTRVERDAFPYRVTEPVKLLFDNAGRHSTLFYRMVFANLWIFNPILSLIGRKGGGEVNGMVRTTTAFTQMSGSKGANVIPAVAYMTSNHRILPGESVASTLARIKKTVNDPKVEISVINGHEPSIVSDTRCAEYSLITDTVSEMWHDAVVTPYLMLACSDSRHWGRICNKVYRFSPLELSSELRGTIHGNNERVSLDAIEKCVEFYIRLMKKL
jgi:carboxypeptidase PM20D1